MNIRIFILLALACLLSKAPIFCQIIVHDVRVSSTYVPASKYVMPAADGNVVTSSKTAQERFGVTMNLDLRVRIDTSLHSVRSWNASIQADYLHMDHKNYPQEVLPTSLLASNITVMHFRTLRNKWAFFTSAAVGINSDLEDVDGNDVFASIGAIFIKSFSPKLRLGFGLYVNNNFGKPLPWPALTVNWQVGSRYQLAIDVPDRGPGLAYNISFTRKLTERTDLGVFFRPNVMSYDVEDAPEGKRLLNNWQIPIGLENTWHFGNLDLAANAGLMALRSFDYAEKDLANMFDKNPYHKLQANLFARVAVRYKFRD